MTWHSWTAVTVLCYVLTYVCFVVVICLQQYSNYAVKKVQYYQFKEFKCVSVHIYDN